jgi:hypothetical protein
MMRKDMKKLLIRALTVCISVLLCAFTGCEMEETLPFNAEDIGNLSEFKEDFLKANTTSENVIYWYENGDGEYEETSPKFRTFIITEKARLDEVFSVCPKIDFEKEMVVMYAYTSEYGRARIITSITLDNKILKIKFKYVKARPFSFDASSPITRFLVIKMDKLDIDKVEFTLLNP